jgi:hypothetical protein
LLQEIRDRSLGEIEWLNMLRVVPWTSGTGVKIVHNIQCIYTKKPPWNHLLNYANSVKLWKKTKTVCIKQDLFSHLEGNKVTDLWSISAELKFDGHMRRVHYKIDRVREYAYPSLDIIFLWCKDACEKLLSDLKRKKADQKDLDCVTKEIEFLTKYQSNWSAKNKKK